MDETPRRIRCTNCGADFGDVAPGQTDFVCGRAGCGAAFPYAQGAAFASVERQRAEKIGYHRLALRRALADQDADAIGRYASVILGMIPDDFRASFAMYLRAMRLPGGDPRPLRRFLDSAPRATAGELRELLPFALDYGECVELKKLNDMLPHYLAGEELSAAAAQIDRRIRLLGEGHGGFADLPRDVFICHSSLSGSAAEDVRESLLRDGWRVWISTHDLDQNCPHCWDEIERAVRQCRVFLVLCTYDAMMNLDVRREMQMAREAGSPRLELKLDDAPHTEYFRAFFDGVAWIDARSGMDAALARLNAAVASLVYPEPPAERNNAGKAANEDGEGKRRPARWEDAESPGRLRVDPEPPAERESAGEAANGADGEGGEGEPRLKSERDAESVHGLVRERRGRRFLGIASRFTLGLILAAILGTAWWSDSVRKEANGGAPGPGAAVSDGEAGAPEKDALRALLSLAPTRETARALPSASPDAGSDAAADGGAIRGTKENPVRVGEPYSFVARLCADGTPKYTADDASEAYDLPVSVTLSRYLTPEYYAENHSAEYYLRGDEAGVRLAVALGESEGLSAVSMQQAILVMFENDAGEVDQGYRFTDAEIGGESNSDIATGAVRTIYKRFKFGLVDDLRYMTLTYYRDARPVTVYFSLTEPAPAAESLGARNLFEASGVESYAMGDAGEGVGLLQRRLIDLGYLAGVPNGTFGKWTAEAVKAAQQDFGLEQTGIADAAFLKILYGW